MNEKNLKKATIIKDMGGERTVQIPGKKKQNKVKKLYCIKCGARNRIEQHDSPAKTKSV